MLLMVQNIAIGVAAVLGGLVLYKVIKNDDSVSSARPCLPLVMSLRTTAGYLNLSHNILSAPGHALLLHADALKPPSIFTGDLHHI